MLKPGGELAAITPSSWTTSEDYETFRRRLRAVADLTELHRFNNRRNLWGPQIVTHDTAVWRARRLSAEEWTNRPRTESPLEVITHAWKERHTHWRHTVRSSEKWIPRKAGATSDERRNPAEDLMTESLFRWRIGRPQLTELKLIARTGPHNDFHRPGEPKADRRLRPDGSSTKKTTPYITPWHVGRRKLEWPTAHAGGAGVPMNWIDSAPASYLQAARLKAGWYVLISTLTGSEKDGHPVHVTAIGTDRFPRGALVSRRILIIGRPLSTTGAPPDPIGRKLALGIEAWLTSSAVTRATWPRRTTRVSRTDITDSAWLPVWRLQAIGAHRSGDESDLGIDERCVAELNGWTEESTIEAAKLATDLATAARFVKQVTPSCPREIVQETTALAVLTARLQPERMIGKATSQAARGVLEFTRERYGRKINDGAAAFLRNAILPWLTKEPVLRLTRGAPGQEPRFTATDETVKRIRVLQTG